MLMVYIIKALVFKSNWVNLGALEDTDIPGIEWSLTEKHKGKKLHFSI